MDKIDKINKMLDEGLAQIDKETNIDKDIRDYSSYIAQKLSNCFGQNVVNEYIENEFGKTIPYMFVLLEDVDHRNGTPLLRLEVSDIQKVQEIALYNMSPDCVKPAIYTPAVFTAPKDGTYSKEDIAQTLVSTAVAKIKGRFKVEEIEEEDDVTVKIDRQ